MREKKDEMKMLSDSLKSARNVSLSLSLSLSLSPSIHLSVYLSIYPPHTHMHHTPPLPLLQSVHNVTRCLYLRHCNPFILPFLFLFPSPSTSLAHLCKDFNLSGTRIASAGMDHALKIWSLDTADVKNVCHRAELECNYREIGD